MILSYKDIKPSIDSSAFIAKSADIIGDVTVGKKSSIWYKTVARGDVNYIKIGDMTNIQDGCLLHVTTDTYPLIVGDNVTVGHGAILHGCKIENNCLIGMGAIILDDAHIAEGCIIGAGAVVPEHSRIEPGTLLVGIPAKAKRKLSDDEIKAILQGAKNYVNLIKDYI